MRLLSCFLALYTNTLEQRWYSWGTVILLIYNNLLSMISTIALQLKWKYLFCLCAHIGRLVKITWHQISLITADVLSLSQGNKHFSREIFLYLGKELFVKVPTCEVIKWNLVEFSESEEITAHDLFPETNPELSYTRQ